MWSFPFTPSAPSYTIEWTALRAAFDWIADMAGVRQEPQWHAEGDVEIHTRMVAEAMAADARWRDADEQARHVLFCAALMHDVAKPACTRFEEGRWTSPHHARVGEMMSRRLLYQGQAGEPPPFHERERICKLVRFHGLPLRFMEKPDPARACIKASVQVKLSEVATLARADVIGRECADKQSLLDSIDMFEAYCQELQCFDQPRHFESNHHRFIYFAAPKPLEYVPYDDTRCEAILMSGLPAAGKSTWIARLKTEQPVICLDELRKELDVDPADDDQSRVINAAKEQAKTLLRRGEPFIWDATNISRDLRGSLVALFANYGARVRIVYVESPWKMLLTQNRARKRQVPESVLLRLVEKLEIPTLVEADMVDNVTG
ncbi:MAG TPA: AAA family ATPase [Humisphaera sp.]|jgi:predicted kinase|nr:AAA family ATPase [Humisphaera sp.]